MAPTIFDDSEAFWHVQARMGWPAGLCEGSFYQTDDGVLQMPSRTTGPGEQEARGSPRVGTMARLGRGLWRPPSPTTTPSSISAGCPTALLLRRLPQSWPARGAQPAVLSLSEDGVRFDRHFVLADEEYVQRRAGQAKGGLYGYPHTMIHDGHLYMIVSLRKEAVVVLRVALANL